MAVAVVAFIPATSLAARVHMNGERWLSVVGGYALGLYSGVYIVTTALGGRALADGRWDWRNYHDPKTWVGVPVYWIVVTAFGLAGANLLLASKLHMI